MDYSAETFLSLLKKIDNGEKYEGNVHPEEEMALKILYKAGYLKGYILDSEDGRKLYFINKLSHKGKMFLTNNVNFL